MSASYYKDQIHMSVSEAARLSITMTATRHKILSEGNRLFWVVFSLFLLSRAPRWWQRGRELSARNPRVRSDSILIICLFTSAFCVCLVELLLVWRRIDIIPLLCYGISALLVYLPVVSRLADG